MTDFAAQIAQQGLLSDPGNIEAFRAWLSSSLFPLSAEGKQHGA